MTVGGNEPVWLDIRKNKCVLEGLKGAITVTTGGNHTQKNVWLNQPNFGWFNHRIWLLYGQPNFWLSKQNSLVNKIWLIRKSVRLLARLFGAKSLANSFAESLAKSLTESLGSD